LQAHMRWVLHMPSAIPATWWSEQQCCYCPARHASHAFHTLERLGHLRSLWRSYAETRIHHIGQLLKGKSHMLQAGKTMKRERCWWCAEVTGASHVCNAHGANLT
jgi:hypothetical protein